MLHIQMLSQILLQACSFTTKNAWWINLSETWLSEEEEEHSNGLMFTCVNRRYEWMNDSLHYQVSVKVREHSGRREAWLHYVDGVVISMLSHSPCVWRCHH